ncbi:unnamed protein product [Medioppia subpectinata]|uniref:Essential protein Yae1 N-terminal domain-containing protein n=1 Tax=Medioppia subpectinata TaxID=1979941 RepID=A0A7R9LUT9_9ACAR|nr:unnamed protein product [Medioppia subpectinata]CAG2121902.1 unnamed protein product [Medioppia subpectinata]
MCVIMSDVFDDNNDNEDIEFANREWNKLNKSLQKDGFKDGIHEGRETGLQKAFDLGYKLSFDPFLTISSFEAIIE